MPCKIEAIDSYPLLWLLPTSALEYLRRHCSITFKSLPLANIHMQPLTEAGASPVNSSVENPSTRTVSAHVRERKTLKEAYGYVLDAVHSKSCHAKFNVYDIMYLSSCQLTKKEVNAVLYHMVQMGLLKMTPLDSLRGPPWFWLPDATTSKVVNSDLTSVQATPGASK